MTGSEKVFSVHGGRCVYCGEKATTIDHMKPVSAGGSDDFSNLAPCCTTCNPRKGAKSVEEYIRYIILRGTRKKIIEILNSAQRQITLEIDKAISENMKFALFAMEEIDRIAKEKIEYYNGGGK